MKVFAIFSSPCGLNGAALNLGSTVHALVGRGHEVVVLCRRPDTASEHLARCGARLIFFNLPLGMNANILLESSDPSLARVVTHHVKDVLRAVVGFPLALYYLSHERPDVFFLMDITFPQCALAGYLWHIPVICEVQEQLIKGRFGLRRRCLIAIYRKCACMFGITAAHIAPFIEKTKTGKWRTTIPNTIAFPPEGLSAESEVLQGMGKRELLLYVGGVNVNKGYDFVLDLLKNLVNSNPNVLLIFAGGFGRGFKSNYAKGSVSGINRETQFLFDFIRQNGLANYIRVVGVRNDIPAIILKSKVVLVPHRTPHFSRPIVEAFALGVPVLASRDNFNADLICDGETGLLADYGDINAWTSQVTRLLNDVSLREQITGNALTLYEHRFNVTSVEKAIVEVFESVMTPGGNIR